MHFYCFHFIISSVNTRSSGLHVPKETCWMSEISVTFTTSRVFLKRHTRPCPVTTPEGDYHCGCNRERKKFIVLESTKSNIWPIVIFERIRTGRWLLNTGLNPFVFWWNHVFLLSALRSRWHHIDWSQLQGEFLSVWTWRESTLKETCLQVWPEPSCGNVHEIIMWKKLGHPIKYYHTHIHLY